MLAASAGGAGSAVGVDAEAAVVSAEVVAVAAAAAVSRGEAVVVGAVVSRGVAAAVVVVDGVVSAGVVEVVSRRNRRLLLPLVLLTPRARARARARNEVPMKDGQGRGHDNGTGSNVLIQLCSGGGWSRTGWMSVPHGVISFSTAYGYGFCKIDEKKRHANISYTPVKNLTHRLTLHQQVSVGLAAILVRVS